MAKMGKDFNLGEFLVEELQEIRKKIDDNGKEVNQNVNQLRTCIHIKIDEVKTEVNQKFTDHDKLHIDHNKLHISSARSYISTRIFLFAMVIIIGCMGTIFTLANSNTKEITAIKATHKIEKVEDENGLSNKNNNQ